MFANIVWSTQSCTLKTFIDSYTLPQLVKVLDGLYSDSDAKTLSAEQVLTLHFTKRTDKLLIQAADFKQYVVPFNCPCKVEILPKICQDKYYSVEDVVHAWTSADFKFIRVVHNAPPSMRIKAGDILRLKKTVEEKRVKFLECEFHDKTKDVLRLPLSFKAAFEPLASVGQYQMQEILKKFQLPVRVKFTSCDTTIHADANDDIDMIDLPSLGSVLLKELRQETTVITTSRDGDVVTVLMIPIDLDVNVIPAHGAVIGDKEYARFCKDIHDGTELTKVDLFENGTKFFEEPTVDVVYDYVEVKPLLPRRYRRESKQSENSDSSDDYEDVEPPPRPPKPPPKPKPKPSARRVSPKVPLVPPYENVLEDNVSEAPNESPSNFQVASPDDCKEVSNNNVDDDDEDLYLSSDFDSDEDYHDYIYPETDVLEPNIPSDSELKASQEKPNLSKKPKKLQIKNRLSAMFKNLASSRPSGNSQKASSATGSSQGQDLAPSSPTAPSNSRQDLTQSSPSAPSDMYKQAFSYSPPFAPSRPSGHFQGASSAMGSPQGRDLAPSPTAPSNSCASPSATGEVSPQAFPDDLRCLSVPEVGECLNKLNMGEHVERFEHDQIDGQLFITLDEAMLPYLGVTNKLQQRKLLMFINGWRPNTLNLL
ncbi:uncharacterized protein LOC144649411 [Oculina patagonica]